MLQSFVDGEPAFVPGVGRDVVCDRLAMLPCTESLIVTAVIRSKWAVASQMRNSIVQSWVRLRRSRSIGERDLGLRRSLERDLERRSDRLGLSSRSRASRERYFLSLSLSTDLDLGRTRRASLSRSRSRSRSVGLFVSLPCDRDRRLLGRTSTSLRLRLSLLLLLLRRLSFMFKPAFMPSRSAPPLPIRPSPRPLIPGSVPFPSSSPFVASLIIFCTSPICLAVPSSSRFAFVRSGTGMPSARNISSSSLCLILRISSLRLSASDISSPSLSALAYQLRSLPFCHRPTGAIREWPR